MLVDGVKLQLESDFRIDHEISDGSFVMFRINVFYSIAAIIYRCLGSCIRNY